MTRSIMMGKAPAWRPPSPSKVASPAVSNKAPAAPSLAPPEQAPPAPTPAAAAPPSNDEATLLAQLAALEKQLAEAKAKEAQSAAAPPQPTPAAADPDGDYQDRQPPVEQREYNEDGDEIIIIEEIVEDGEEFEEDVIEIEEEVYDGSEYEEIVEDTSEYEEVVEEETVREEDEEETPVIELQAYSPRSQPKPKVPLVDPPREPQTAAPPPPAPVPAGPPTAVPAGNPPAPVAAARPPPPKPVPVKESGPKNDPAVTAAAKAEDKPQEEAKPRKKWVPMSQRFPDKFKANSGKTGKALSASAAAVNGTADAAAASDDKPKKAYPLPFKPRAYPKVPASPAGQETPMEKLLGAQLLKNVQLQKMTVNSALQDQELVLLYFGAAWRKECKRVHQPLTDFYRLVSKDEKLECVYVSVDRTLFEFKDIFQKFDFLAMPTGTTQLKNQLTRALKIVDLPVMAVFEPSTGNIITADAAPQILDLPSRDKPAAIALAQSWKQAKAVPLDQLQKTITLVPGNNNKGNIYFHNN